MASFPNMEVRMKLIPEMLKVASIIMILFFAAGSQAAITPTGNINPADPATWTAATNGSVGYSSVGTLEINGGSSITSNNSYLGYNSGANGTVTITGAGSSWANNGDLIVGRAGTGTLTLLDGGSISNNYGTIGWLEGSVGTVTVDNSVWINNTSLNIGTYGNGTLTISGGGEVSNIGNSSIGYFGGSTGAVTVTGTGSNWTNTNDLRVGVGGTGALNILDGGAVESGSSIIGHGSSGNGTVTVDNATWTIGQGSVIGSEGNGSLNILNGGTVVSSGWSHIGNNAGATGEVTITGTGSTWDISSAQIDIGYSGTGTLTITDSGLLSSAGGAIGRYLGSSGNVTVNNSTWSNSGNLIVGNDGTGTLTIENGGTVTSTFAAISLYGGPSGSSGTATVTGAGSTWTSSDNFVVGGTASGGMTASIGQGNGTLNISAGGTVSNVNGYLGSDTGAVGTVNVDGAGSTWTNSGTLTIGRNGGGTLDISNGGVVSNTAGYIGTSSTSTGAVTISGSGSTWTNSNILNIGYSGTGTLDILNGGRVDSSYGFIGQDTTGAGTVTVNGPGSTWSSTAGITIGEHGTGTLNILNGGAASTGGNVYVGVDPTQSTGTVSIDGSNSSWTISDELHIGHSSIGTMTVTNGGAVSNDDGYIGTMTNSYGHVTVSGSGSTWNNSGDLSIGTAGNGELNISSGGEVMAAAATIESTGLLSGDSLMTLNNGTGILTNYGTIAPGNSIGTLTVDGDVIFASGSTFEVEIDNAGNSDLLDVSGDVTINSGSTIAINSNGETITDGKSYTLIEAAGITGTFDTLDTALVIWDAAVTSYDMAYDATTATLVIGTPSVTPFNDSSLLRTYNQRAVGGAIEQISTAGGTLGGITAAIQGIVAEADLRYAYDQLSGQTRPSIAPIANAGVSLFNETILKKMDNLPVGELGVTERDHAGHDYYFWVEGLGDFGQRDSKDGVNGSDYKVAGVVTGLDYLIAKDFRAGASLGLSSTDVDYDDTRDNSRIDSFYSALYGSYTGFDGYIDAILSYAYLDSETVRYVDFINEKNEGNFNGYEISASVEAAKNYSFKDILLQPLGDFTFGYQRQGGYTETGGTSALRYGKQILKSYTSSLGVRVSKYFYKNNKQSLWGQLQGKWIHQFGDAATNIRVGFASTPDYHFTIKDARMDRDSAVLGVGLKYEPREHTRFFVNYETQVNNDIFNHVLSGGIRLAF
jgi:T5SS/PEP-CTERM-associated repeat protein